MVKKKQKQAIAYVSRWICIITRSSNITQHINQNCQMLLNEILTKWYRTVEALVELMEVIPSMFWSLFWIWSEIVFAKKCNFLRLCSILLYFFYETFPHSSVDKKECMKLDYYMFRYSYNKIFLGLSWKFCENDEKCWRWQATFFKKKEKKILAEIDLWQYLIFHCQRKGN